MMSEPVKAVDDVSRSARAGRRAQEEPWQPSGAPSPALPRAAASSSSSCAGSASLSRTSDDPATGEAERDRNLNPPEQQYGHQQYRQGPQPQRHQRCAGEDSVERQAEEQEQQFYDADERQLAMGTEAHAGEQDYYGYDDRGGGGEDHEDHHHQQQPGYGFPGSSYGSVDYATTTTTTTSGSPPATVFDCFPGEEAEGDGGTPKGPADDENNRNGIDDLQRKLHFYQVMLWLKRSYRLGATTSLTKRCVYQDYFHMCPQSGIPCLFSPSVFGKVIKRTFPDLKYRRKRVNRRINAHYEGLERVEECFDAAGNPRPLPENIKREHREEAERLRLEFQDKKIGGRQYKNDSPKKGISPAAKHRRYATAAGSALKSIKQEKTNKRRRTGDEDGTSGSSSPSMHPVGGPPPQPPAQFWRDWSLLPTLEATPVAVQDVPAGALISEEHIGMEPALWSFPLTDPPSYPWGYRPPPQLLPPQTQHSLPSLPVPSFPLPSTMLSSFSSNLPPSSSSSFSSSSGSQASQFVCPCNLCRSQRYYSSFHY